MRSPLRCLLAFAMSASLIASFGCASRDVPSGGIYDVVFYATGTVAEVNIDGGRKTVAVLIESCNYEEPKLDEQALFDFSDFDVSWRVPRDDLDGIHPGDKVRVSFFLSTTKSDGYPGEKITKLLE